MTLSQPAVVEAADVRVYYREGALAIRRKYVTEPFSVAIQPNEFVGLAGPSGVGKTSIGKALVNLIPTWEGNVFWDGENVRQIDDRSRRSRFSWICQEPTLAFNPRRSIGQVLSETLAVHHVEARDVISELCETMNLSPTLQSRYPFELSAGQIQRFALIRVFMLKPRFVVLDEATSSLDPINQLQILDYILEWRKRYGLAALFIGHSRRLLSKVADRVLTLTEMEVRR